MRIFFIVGALATSGGNKGLEFLKGNFKVNVRKGEEEKPETRSGSKAATSKNGQESYVVTVNGREYNVKVREGTSDVEEVKEVKTAPSKTADASGESVQVTAGVPGNVYKISVKVGDEVSENDTLLVLEAMKMETPVASPVSGVVSSIEVNPGDVVEAGQLLLTINAG